MALHPSSKRNFSTRVRKVQVKLQRPEPRYMRELARILFYFDPWRDTWRDFPREWDSINEHESIHLLRQWPRDSALALLDWLEAIAVNSWSPAICRLRLGLLTPEPSFGGEVRA